MKPGSLKLKNFDVHHTSIPCVPGVYSSEEPSFFVTNVEIILGLLTKRIIPLPPLSDWGNVDQIWSLGMGFLMPEFMLSRYVPCSLLLLRTIVWAEQCLMLSCWCWSVRFISHYCFIRIFCTIGFWFWGANLINIINTVRCSNLHTYKRGVAVHLCTWKRWLGTLICSYCLFSWCLRAKNSLWIL